MRKLFLDIETASSAKLKECGVYRYTEASDFTVTLFAYAFDDDEARVVDLAHGEQLPCDVEEALASPYVLKFAHNEEFDRVCLEAAGYDVGDPVLWYDTALYCRMFNLPHKLRDAAALLCPELPKLDEDGKLVRKYSQPKSLVRSLFGEEPDWAKFKEYAVRDVEAMRAVFKALLQRWPAANVLIHRQHAIEVLHRIINQRGVPVNERFVRNAILIAEREVRELIKRATEIAAVNVRSVQQLSSWLTDRGYYVSSLRSTTVEKLLKEAEHRGDDAAAELLRIRQSLSRYSVKKYDAMLKSLCEDGRIRGLFVAYGAHTGRWAGRGVQPQNLPRPEREHGELLQLREQVLRGGRVELDALRDMLRTAFEAPQGFVFIISDFSSIEARVLAWLAGEEWKLEVFRTHGKIYEAAASRMFGVPIEQITKGSDLRQKGKVAELALGYQGSVGALDNMARGAFTEEEVRGIVERWRAANQRIVALWHAVETAFATALSEGEACTHELHFVRHGDTVGIGLPSGRWLFYPEARFDGRRLSYTDPQRGRIETYGGRLVENIVQAVARDVLAEAMLAAHKAGLRIVMHVHDEIVCEAAEHEAEQHAATLEQIMSTPPSWAEGLPLGAEAEITKTYKK